MCSSHVDSPCTEALETSRSMKAESAIFKKPSGFVRRTRKTKILDEDTYIETMGMIIQRDFFPHLERLKAQNDYLDALEQNDAKKMRALYTKYSSEQPISERLASPATFETPLLRGDNVVDPESDKPLMQPLANSEHFQSDKEHQKTTVTNTNRVRLNSYLSTHTSEDNISFEEIMVESEKRRRIKYAWLYEAEDKANKQLEEQKLFLTKIEDGATKTSDKPLSLDGWGYRMKNFVMYVPDGVELTSEERIELAKKKQEIVHENTRLTVNPFNEKQNNEAITELVQSQPRTNDEKIGVDGKEIVRNSTPWINGFTFVPSTPSPKPGECQSPLMTWGQIEGTPFRLDGGDTPLLRTNQGPSFRMAKPPKREIIALQLAEKAGERHRDRKNKALEAARRSLTSPSPKSLSTIDRLSTMSPAARRLAAQKLKIAGSIPSPLRSTSKTTWIGVKTPSSISTPKATPSNDFESDHSSRSKGIALTDNLLNLPTQRQRASDFFNK